jgi:uncharacterized protein YfcZ (UPF0381/DUF406 family)
MPSSGCVDFNTMMLVREHTAEIRQLHSRMDQTERRLDRTNTRVRDHEARIRSRIVSIEAKVDMLMEIAKWIAFAALILAGAWDKLPEPLRQRLLGG